MLEKLTTDRQKPVWVNLDMIVKMETISVQDGYPPTQLMMFVGGSINVFESPEQIATLASFDPNEE